MTKDCPVEILQYAWEFDIVLDLYKRVKPRTVLEIGSLYGGTIYHWLTKSEIDVTVMSVDLFVSLNELETSKLWQSWKKKGQLLKCIKGNSASSETIDSVKSELKDGVDWLFIDGDHSYQGVKSDYENYSPLLNENGYCIFHDIFGENDVAKYWTELKDKLGHDVPIIEICHSKYKLGIGIIQKYDKLNATNG